MFKPKSLRLKNFMSFTELNFMFRNGAAIAILGKNHDDPGQKVNGAGKTAFIEGMAVAYSGGPLRDIKVKELINDRGADSCEIGLDHENTETGQIFSIWRKLYSNTKSAEYKAFIDGVDQSDRYSDFNMFNEFVWTTLGISKEDFFSFYLITREDDYKPFLKMGDVAKKAIINRFSGADKVDLVFPKIEEDVKKLTDEVLLIEKEFLQNTTKQELLTEQLIKEENELSEENRGKAIDKKEQELFEFMQAADNSGSVPTKETDLDSYKEALELARDNWKKKTFEAIDILQPFKVNITAAELLVTNFKFSRDFDFELLQLTVKKEHKQKEIDQKKLLMPKIKEQFIAEIKAISDEEAELKVSLEESEKDLKEQEKFESEVNKQLQDSIECPKCSHHFSLRDKTFNYEEAQKQLPLTVQLIADYKEVITDIKLSLNTTIHEKKENINKKIIVAGEGLKNEIGVLNNELVELGSRGLVIEKEKQAELQNKRVLINAVTDFKNALADKERSVKNDIQVLDGQIRRCELTLQSQQQELKSYQDRIIRMTSEIDAMRLEELDRSKLEQLEATITTLILAEDGIKDRLEAKRKEKESIDAWEINFKNFKSHLANKSIKNIQDYTNLFLEAMGSNLAIKIDGYRTLASKKLSEKITTTVLRDGFEAGSYGKYSGGERGRIDICTILAMQELININTHQGVDLLIVDEIMDQVDVMGLESIINSLQSLGKTIMIVSQQEVNTLPGYTLTIQKKNKVSTICN